MLDIQAEWVEDITQDLPTDDSRDATPIDTYTDRSVFNAGVLVDGAGNLCEGYSTLQGNTTVVRLFLVDHMTGARRAVADVAPPPLFKLDSAAMTQSGANLLLGLTAHEAISSPTRRNIYARALVPGVVTPYPGGATPRGAYIDPALLGGLDPVGEPIDAQAIANAVLATLNADTNYHATLQKYAKNGAREAIAAEGVSTPAYLQTPDSLLTVLKDGLYSWMRDRLWETFIQFLSPKPPTPPQDTP